MPFQIFLAHIYVINLSTKLDVDGCAYFKSKNGTVFFNSLLTFNAVEKKSSLSLATTSESEPKLPSLSESLSLTVGSDSSSSSSCTFFEGNISAACCATFCFSISSCVSTCSACSRNSEPNFSKKPPSTCWILKIKYSYLRK